MTFNKLQSSFLTICTFSLFLFTTSCGDDGKDVNADDEKLEDDDSANIKNAALVNVNGELFSIPSPVQTAMLIQKVGAGYNKDMLNASSNYANYKTDFSKALNLGIYGADLGYVTMYNMTADALSYLAQVKKLSDDIGVSGAFDSQTLERIKKNMNVKDSMLILVGIAYRTGDAFLKNNRRNDLSALILTGGWIESMNFSVVVNREKQNVEIQKRIVEQRQSLESIVKLLTQFESTESEYGFLLSGLRDIKKIYDGITVKYVYVKPDTDADKKITVINSTTEMTYSKEQIEQISAKLQELRNKIVNPTNS